MRPQRQFQFRKSNPQPSVFRERECERERGEHKSCDGQGVNFLSGVFRERECERERGEHESFYGQGVNFLSGVFRERECERERGTLTLRIQSHAETSLDLPVHLHVHLYDKNPA